MAGDYACGERILWLQSPAGGSLSEAAACRRVAGEYAAECGECIPEATEPTPPSSGIRVSGRSLLIGDEPFIMKGVCWNAVPRGAVHPPSTENELALATIDAPLMAAAGINTVRTYTTVASVAVLNAFWAHGIYVVNPINPLASDSDIDAAVDATKAHPALLMWSLGNEWNYNGLYVDLPHAECIERIDAAARRIKARDGHPVVSVYGELPSADTVVALSAIDVWALNVYRYDDFGDLFAVWAERTPSADKPMLLGEWGADAYNSNGNDGAGAEDQPSQAAATTTLGDQIIANLVPNNGGGGGGGVCFGGALFEWADEWWKAGNEWQHDVGGTAPGGGPYPDRTFNEEWWGLVDVERTPRLAYAAYRDLVFGSSAEAGAPAPAVSPPPSLPPPPSPPPPSPSPLSPPPPSPPALCGTSSCTAAVWERMAGDYACGERILWLQSPAGGSFSETASCRQVAGMEYAAECGACSP